MRIGARTSWLAVSLTVVVMMVAAGTTASSATSRRATDGLSGSWRVTRVCSTGCKGTTSGAETVVKLHSHVFKATGTLSLVLYNLGGQRILVHGSTASTLLTVVKSGQLMRGKGIDGSGDTLRVTWQCVAASPSSRRSAHTAGRRVRPLARAIC